jgi:predicted AAA+ superfamily ATPase
MPEVVSSFIHNNDYDEVRSIQKEILTAYDQDFSKHVPPDVVPRVRQLWNSIPSQLSKENRKFIFGLIKKGARAREYEMALMWLIDCGLIYQIKRISKPDIPLKGYADNSAFKIYMSDVGLLAAMGDIDVKTLLEGNAIFEEFKGALTEQYVLQQLIVNPDMPIFYWSAEKQRQKWTLSYNIPEK